MSGLSPEARQILSSDLFHRGVRAAGDRVRLPVSIDLEVPDGSFNTSSAILGAVLEVPHDRIPDLLRAIRASVGTTVEVSFSNEIDDYAEFLGSGRAVDGKP